jgi:hypothetical protein
LLQRIEVEYAYMARGSGAGKVEIAAVGVGGYVVKSAIATDELDVLDFIWTVVLCMRQSGEREDAEGG